MPFEVGLNALDVISSWEQPTDSVQSIIRIINRLVETGAVGEIIPTFGQLNNMSLLENKRGERHTPTPNQTLQLMTDYRVRALSLHHL